jgi:hypothetical protein
VTSSGERRCLQRAESPSVAGGKKDTNPFCGGDESTTNEALSLASRWCCGDVASRGRHRRVYSGRVHGGQARDGWFADESALGEYMRIDSITQKISMNKLII